ncbi:MAG: AmmeMemoRadiSam system protein B [Calditrichaceae bacterium]|nr:AmmeMemoRadiSam system protein B [Calditrichaceae bacterium]MBN2707426.1 AmmeMemoRadiSam system protein B [Calditrichaceae bacterium]RQV93995.1 MAG: AmmeMemoRadiSam system protein B [Calditrichota bacterium]
MSFTESIRYPAVAGMFYPGDENTLRKDINGYIKQVPQLENVKKIYGLVAPHAGYMYSGAVAAQAYRQLEGHSFDTVVVVSPSHRAYFKENSIYPGAYYQTPLGNIEVDSEAAQALAESGLHNILSQMGHDGAEHALEVQLPFLQVVLKEFKLIPVVMGDQGYENVTGLAEALTDTLKDKKALMVASSDLSHYHDSKLASQLDNVVVDEINKFNIEGLYRSLTSGICEMCGGGPVMSVMMAGKLLGADKAKVLTYKTSGDITGDHHQVVGYLSALFYQ